MASPFRLMTASSENFWSNGWSRGAVMAAAAGSAALLWSLFCTVPAFYWNPPRLAPAFALANGLKIYATRASGAHLGWHYGPVFPLFSLPATLAGNVTVAFWIWSGLNLAAILVPAWVVLREALGGGRAAWTGLALYLALLLGNPVTLSMVHSIHVDALCVGWGLLACWCVHRAIGSPAGERYLHGAAVGVVLAIGTKQVAVTLVPAFLVWFWWHQRRALAGRLFFWLVVYSGLLAVVFVRWFGGEELIFNLWLVHVRTPRWGGTELVAREAARLFWSGWVWIVAAGLALWSSRSAPEEKRAPPGLERLLLWVALWQLPLGLWAVTKVGGGLNSTHSIHYLLPVVAIWLTRAARRAPAPGRRWRPAGAAVLLVTVVALGNGFRTMRVLGTKWWPDRGQEKLLQMARADPGRLYFPWNPLVTIIADRKVYPFDNALFCLSIAGQAPSTAAVRAALPAHPIVIYPEPAQSKFALNYLPESPRNTGRGQSD